MTSKDLICIGKISGAHGIRGQVKIRSFTENPENISEYKDIMDRDGNSLSISFAQNAKNNVLIASINGVLDRNTADSMAGIELFIDKIELPEANEGEFYHNELIGLRVKTRDGKEIGFVKAMHNFGAGDIIDLELLEKTRSGNKKNEMMLFNKQNVPVIDIKGGFIVVEMPEEMLEED